MKPQTPTVFLSCSFSDEDMDVVDRIARLLESLGIGVYRARYIPWIPDSIIEKIKELDLLVAILTPRADTEVPHAITFEIGCAMAAGKHVIVLREDCLDKQEIIPGKFQQPFNRTLLRNEDHKHVSEITQGIRELFKWFGYALGTVDKELDVRLLFAMEKAPSLGTKILGFFNDVLYKNDVRDRAVKNFPTEADLRANSFIEESLRSDAWLSNDGFITEESSHDASVIKKILASHEFIWVIDPLDGTLNFAYGFQFFCVAIGLLRNGEPVLGVVYNPSSQELFLGRSGRISERVSLQAGSRSALVLNAPKYDLEDCIVMTHLSSDSKARKKTIGCIPVLRTGFRQFSRGLIGWALRIHVCRSSLGVSNASRSARPSGDAHASRTDAGPSDC